MDLLSLPSPLLRSVIGRLPLSDCRRLAAVCQHFRWLVAGTVTSILLSQQVGWLDLYPASIHLNTYDIPTSHRPLQVLGPSLCPAGPGHDTHQDLEDCADEALCTFKHATQLHLADLSLNLDCALELTATAPQLLQGLQSLQVWWGHRLGVHCLRTNLCRVL